MHWVHHNLAYKVEIWQPRELRIPCRFILDEFVTSCLTCLFEVLFAQAALFSVSPWRESCLDVQNHADNSQVTVHIPPCMYASGVALSACLIQHFVQKYVCEWAPNPAILCAAGLSHTRATSATRMSCPTSKCEQKGRLCTLGTRSPSGQDGVGILIPSFHSRRKSLTTGRRNR